MSAKIVHARALAAEAARLLDDVAGEAADFAPYQVRIAQGIANSLVDSLEELERGPSSSRKLKAAQDTRDASV